MCIDCDANDKVTIDNYGKSKKTNDDESSNESGSSDNVRHCLDVFV